LAAVAPGYLPTTTGRIAPDDHHREEYTEMAALLIFALLVAVLFGLGFAIDVLLWVAIVAALVWVVGFFARGAERTWYRW
jgi:ABC-type transport system involved in cytochrome c biogenesis permease component